MTVCIAAACQDKGQPRIVLCSDTRLDYQDIGSTSTTVKIDVLGYGWCIQLAGEWSGVKYLGSILISKIQNLSSAPTSLKQIENEINSGLDEFIRSAFCEDDKRYETLLSGFIGNKPSIVQASVNEGHPKLQLNDSFAAIGYGYTVSSALLTLRECNFSMPLSYVTYLAYEAKKCSEKTGQVGAHTVLALQSLGPSPKDKAHIKILSEVGKAALDVVHYNFWKVPFCEMPDFPERYFIDPTEKQSLQ
jgi:hypothetical protein